MELTLNSMRRPAQMLARRAKKPAPEQVAEDELAAVPEEADAVVPEEEAPADDIPADEFLDDPSLDSTLEEADAPLPTPGAEEVSEDEFAAPAPKALVKPAVEEADAPPKPAPAPAAPAAPASALDVSKLANYVAQQGKPQGTQPAAPAQTAAPQQEVTEDRVPTASSMNKLEDLLMVLRRAGYGLSLTSSRTELLTKLAEFDMLKAARALASLPPDAFVSLVGKFIPAAKLIPMLRNLGFRPAHETQIDETYPTTAAYELAMTNGIFVMIVSGAYDFDKGTELTTVRYASKNERQRYGLLNKAAALSVSAAMSGHALYPSKMLGGQALLSADFVQNHVVPAHTTDSVVMTAGASVLVCCSAGQQATGKLMGFIHDKDNSNDPLVLSNLSDGYMISELKDVFVNGAPHG